MKQIYFKKQPFKRTVLVAGYWLLVAGCWLLVTGWGLCGHDLGGGVFGDFLFGVD